MNTPAQSSETAQKQTKHPTRHRIQFLFISIIALVAISAAGGLWYHHLHRYIPGKITFQEYAPDYFPANSSIKEKSIQAWYIPAGNPTRYTMLDLEMTDGSSIYEQRRDVSSFYSCNLGYVTNMSCDILITPRGQQYTLTTTTVPGQNITQSIEWLRGDTSIIVNLENTSNDGYSQETLEKIIDSFKPVEYKGLEVRYIDKSTV